MTLPATSFCCGGDPGGGGGQIGRCAFPVTTACCGGDPGGGGQLAVSSRYHSLLRRSIPVAVGHGRLAPVTQPAAAVIPVAVNHGR